jgi:hypothetical protein
LQKCILKGHLLIKLLIYRKNKIKNSLQNFLKRFFVSSKYFSLFYCLKPQEIWEETDLEELIEKKFSDKECFGCHPLIKLIIKTKDGKSFENIKSSHLLNVYIKKKCVKI